MFIKKSSEVIFAVAPQKCLSITLFRKNPTPKVLRQQHRWKSGICYKHLVGTRPLKYASLGQELEIAANRWPSRPAVVSLHERKTLTYSELFDESEKLAAALTKMGMEKGDRFGIWMPNYTQWIVALMAASRIGLISVAINHMYRQAEMEYALKKVGVKGLLAAGSRCNKIYYDVLADIIPELRGNADEQFNSEKFPGLKFVALIEDEGSPGTVSYDKLMGIATNEEIAKVTREAYLVNPDSGCNIQYTSGTTGNPKAVVLPHNGIVNNGFFVGLRNELNEDHKTICVQNPLFHVYGVILTISAGIQHGATMVLPSPTYSPKANVQALLTEKIDLIHGTPTMYVDLVNEVKSRNITGIRAKMAMTGGATVTPKLVQNISSILGVETVRSVFGMTESSAANFQSIPGEDKSRTLHYVGLLHDHLEAKVINDNNDTVQFGQPGELAVRGYSSMLEYWGDEEKTKEIYGNDKWLKTGYGTSEFTLKSKDQVILEEDGYCKIVGRIKDIIIRGGENIAPKEIEDITSTHPDVLECQVFGVEDERLGEEICLVVRLKETTTFDEDLLKNHISRKLAKYKVPRIIKNIDAFPKTASGKVQKFKLKKMVEDGLL